MKQVKFSVDGVKGEFFVDADELNNYRTMKALAFGTKNPVGMYEALERIYMGHDEEYVERVGGLGNVEKLNNAAAEAVKAELKNS